MSTAMNCSNEICGAAGGTDIAVARGSKSEGRKLYSCARKDKSAGDGAG
jgi:hypothetical protein